MNSENNKGKSQAVEQANSKDALVQKLEGAMRKLRHDRDKEYRELMEAEGRLRLAREEETALEKIIADLKSKHSNLASQKQELQASLGPLEAQVQDMTEKTQFQHNELLGAREKIKSKTREIKESAEFHKDNCQSIRRLSQMSRHKLSLAHNELVFVKEQVCVQKESLERELNCSMIDWETLPELMEEKANIYMAEANRLHEVNKQIEMDLAKQGLAIPENSSNEEMTDDTIKNRKN